MQRLVAQGVWPEQAWLEGRIEPVLAAVTSRRWRRRCLPALAADHQAGAWCIPPSTAICSVGWRGGWRAISAASRADLSGVAPGRQQTMAVRAYVGSAGMAICAATVTSTWCRRSALPAPLKPFIYGLAMDEGLVHSASCSPMRQGWVGLSTRQFLRRLSGGR